MIQVHSTPSVGVLWFLLQRLMQALVVLLGVFVFVFFLFHAVGGDPAYQMLGKHASLEQVAEARRLYGWDQPLWIQLGQSLWRLLQGDFGVSFVHQTPISNLILKGMWPSLSLMVPAFLVTTLFSLSVALLSAYWKGSRLDRAIGFFCVVGVSFPLLAVILMAQFIFAYRLGWFPISGYDPHWPGWFRSIALPMLIYCAVSSGFDIRYYRAALLEEVAQDYVRTARAKGLSESGVYFKHVLKNALIPVITHVVLEIPLLVLGTFLLESFFGIPGLGGLTLEAIHGSDLPVIQAMTLFEAFLFVLGNTATDVLYYWADPRLRVLQEER
jgi:peptide/nickel transport system permease protein